MREKNGCKKLKTKTPKSDFIMPNIRISEEENKISNEESIYIWGYLRRKYCNDTIKDRDIILNSLCFALVNLTLSAVHKKDRQYFLDSVVMPILIEGLKRGECYE